MSRAEEAMLNPQACRRMCAWPAIWIAFSKMRSRPSSYGCVILSRVDPRLAKALPNRVDPRLLTTGECFGKTPMQTFLDAMLMTKEKTIAA
jgi:hypothetical protein